MGKGRDYQKLIDTTNFTHRFLPFNTLAMDKNWKIGTTLKTNQNAGNRYRAILREKKVFYLPEGGPYEKYLYLSEVLSTVRGRKPTESF